jgi:hypothetical protein
MFKRPLAVNDRGPVARAFVDDFQLIRVRIAADFTHRLDVEHPYVDHGQLR